MTKKFSKLQLAQQEAEIAVEKVNEKIEELGKYSGDLYVSLTEIQTLFDCIRKMPEERRLKYEKLKKIRMNWKQQVEKIEKDYKETVTKIGVGAAGAGTSAGVAVATLAPTAAMGVATTFGVASTGTPITSLSGAVATKAALAWIGGGALSAGGGGIAAGKAVLALAGPVGWVITGVAIISSGFMLGKAISDKKKIENIFTLISERDINSYRLALVELGERIVRIDNENEMLKKAIVRIKSFGTDYSIMTESQQYELGTYVNLMNSSTQLLVNPIMGLQPKYSSDDFSKFISWKERKADEVTCIKLKLLIISLANLLYKIDLDDTDKKILFNTFRKNKEMLETLNIDKKDFTQDIMDVVEEALFFKEKNEYDDALYNLGERYYLGRGVPVDEQKAVEFYIKSAEKGNPKAQYKLGVCYEYGRGIPKDDSRAIYWYTKASAQYYPYALYKLGVRYFTGRGVCKNEEKAKALLFEAKERGCDAAKEWLD